MDYNKQVSSNLLSLPFLTRKVNSLFKLQRDSIHNKDLRRQHQPGHLPKVQTRGQEIQRRSPIHRRNRNVEREPLNFLIHQDPEVISQKRPRDPETIVARQDERVANNKQDDTKSWQVNRRVERLVRESFREERVAEEAEGEDGSAEEVAARVRGFEEVGQEACAVFVLSDKIPGYRVESYCDGSDVERLL